MINDIHLSHIQMLVQTLVGVEPSIEHAAAQRS